MRKLAVNYEFLRPKETHPLEKELVDQLRECGLDIKSINELKMTRESYPEALPVLLSYLKKYPNTNEAVLDTVVRCLITPEARGVAFGPINELYLAEKDSTESGVKYAMAHALQYLSSTDDEIAKIINLSLNSLNGSTRIAFIDKIASVANKNNVAKIKSVLEILANDEDKYIAKRAQKALMRKKFK